MILPKITVLGLIGMTASCSKVPRSRSLTMPMLVTMVPMKARIRPMIAGTMTQAVSRSGLNSTCTSTWSPSLLKAETAACAANRFDPST